MSIYYHDSRAAALNTAPTAPAHNGQHPRNYPPRPQLEWIHFGVGDLGDLAAKFTDYLRCAARSCDKGAEPIVALIEGLCRRREEAAACVDCDWGDGVGEMDEEDQSERSAQKCWEG